MIKKNVMYVCFLSLLCVSSGFAFNPNDPIGWEYTKPFLSTVSQGSGPYVATFTFKNQTQLGFQIPFTFKVISHPANAYTLGNTTCPSLISSDATCTVNINFNPTNTGVNTVQLEALLGMFGTTVPLKAMSVNVVPSSVSTPPTPPPSSNKFLMWEIPSSAVSYPVYVYKSGAQVSYIPSASSQVFVGAYPSQANGLFTLYYQKEATWHSCNIGLHDGYVSKNTTTCLGTVINPPSPSTSNVYTLAVGAIAFPRSSEPTPAPQAPDYTTRKIIFKNMTGHAIHLQGTCQKFPACASGYAVTLADGDTTDITVGTGTLNSGAFYVTGICTTTPCGVYPNGHWIKTGGYNQDNGGYPYAVKIEPTFLPVTDGIPSGSTNVDVSAVDGFNIGVKLYPSSPTYCTYTVPPESSNVLGAGYYSSAEPLAQIPQGLSLSTVCAESSQLPTGGTGWPLNVGTDASSFAGCMSPCTYAAKTYGVNSDKAHKFCCSGNYNTPETCIAPSSSTVAANNSQYVAQVYANFPNVYPFAYGDAGSDYGCPADTNLTVEFVS